MLTDTKETVMLLFLGLLFIFLYIFSLSLNYRARLFLKHLPTFTQFPFLGSMHKFINLSGIDLMAKLEEASKLSDKKGLPFVVWFAHIPFIILSNPEDVKAVAQAFIEKPYYYNFGKIWLGDGLVTASGKIWKENIKKIGGTFTRSVVNGYQEVFNHQAQKFVEELRRKADKPPFEFTHYITQRTLETICQTGFGFTNITETIATKEYSAAFNAALRLLLSRGFNILYHWEWLYRLTSGYRNMKKQVAVLKNVSNTVLKKRLQDRQEAKKLQNSIDSVSERKSTFKSLLDVLLDLSETDSSLTENQIQAEVDTAIVGGQETVTVALLFAFLMIGCHPDVEAKLYAEIKKVLGDKHDVDTEDLSRMVYCEAFIYETLRMFPPLPVIMRYADRDLKLGSCTIPRGATVLINAWGSGRSESLWGRSASHFNPNRWLTGEPCAASCLAFSVGRRSCLGKTYAIAFLKTVLAHCVKELVFQSEAHKLQLTMDVVLHPVSGHLFQVKLRNKDE